jgi:hypothetical protein
MIPWMSTLSSDRRKLELRRATAHSAGSDGVSGQANASTQCESTESVNRLSLDKQTQAHNVNRLSL